MVDENGDEKTTDEGVLSAIQIFDSKTVEEKNEMIVKEQIGDEKWDERMQFDRDPSTSSCLVKDVTSFVYGAGSSRFWLYRKHINSMQTN